MPKEKIKVKPIGINKQNIKNNMEKTGLIPNKSYENFILGDDITNYLHLPHHVEFYDHSKIDHDSYFFDNVNFYIWVKNGKIETIKCDKECYWKGKNLINMFYEDFLMLIDYQQPSDEDIIYVPINRDRGQNQKVYTFDYLGLMIWVWRKKIRTVLIYNYEDE